MNAATDLSEIWNDSLRGDYLWTSTNFGEALPDVMTPLTYSMMQRYVTANRLDFGFSNIPMAGRIGGRLYMNMSLLGGFLRTIGFTKSAIKKLAEDAFGRLPEEVDIPIPKIERSVALRSFLSTAIGRFRLVRRLKPTALDFVRESSAATRMLEGRIRLAKTPGDLLLLWQDQIDPWLTHTMQMLSAGTSDYKNISRRLRARLTDLVGEGAANALMAGFPGKEAIESMGPLLGLARVKAGKLTPEEYLARYGHRGPSELELSRPAPSEIPGWLNEQLERMTGDAPDPFHLIKENQESHSRAWRDLSAKHPFATRSIRRGLIRLNAASRTREAVRSEVVRRLRIARAYALRASEITRTDSQVFFLSFQELTELLQGDRNVLHLVPERQALYERLLTLPPYPALIRGPFDPFEWAERHTPAMDFYDGSRGTVDPPASEDPHHLNGFAGSPGLITGRARVLDSLDNQDDLQPGEILVTHTTNVGWTLLFYRAAAIVTDVGAPLSHAAIVARELGIPAVVGTGDATRHIRTGDSVQVDGGNGQVWIMGNKPVADH